MISSTEWCVVMGEAVAALLDERIITQREAENLIDSIYSSDGGGRIGYNNDDTEKFYFS